jgi:soluble lytic murein transglycosylase-like protein
MIRALSIVVLVLVAGLSALAQERARPLSPPERAPVPLTDDEQQQALAESAAKPAKTEGSSGRPTVPAVHGKHISSGDVVIDSLAYEAAARYGLDPCLIITVMQAESGFRRQAVSHKGACGLMQLIPATAVRFGVRNIFDPRENVLGGASYLRWLLNRFGGDVRLALAGYNAGEGAVETYGYRIPPYLETQNYVKNIYARYSRIHAQTGSGGYSPAITESSSQSPTSSASSTPEKIPTYNQIIPATSSSSGN